MLEGFDLETYKQEMKDSSNEHLEFLLTQFGRNGETNLGVILEEVVSAELQTRKEAGVIKYDQGTMHYRV